MSAKTVVDAAPEIAKVATQATEAVKAGVEKATAASSQAFKEGVEKSLTALQDLNEQSKANLEAVVASATAATKGAEALGTQFAAFSKKAFEDHSAATKAFAGVKSIQEAMELQSSYAKTALEGYMAEMGKLTETMTASFKDSVQPINARVTEVVTKLQAAR